MLIENAQREELAKLAAAVLEDIEARRTFPDPNVVRLAELVKAVTACGWQGGKVTTRDQDAATKGEAKHWEAIEYAINSLEQATEIIEDLDGDIDGECRDVRRAVKRARKALAALRVRP